jgi:hypothetical protein
LNPLTIRVFNTNGSVVYTSQAEVLKGVNKISLDISSKASGVYYLQVLDGCKAIHSVRVVKK